MNVSTPPLTHRIAPRGLRRARRARLGRLLGDTRGAVTTEYIVLVGTMALTFIAAMLVVGPRLMRDFYRSRAIIQAPFP